VEIGSLSFSLERNENERKLKVAVGNVSVEYNNNEEKKTFKTAIGIGSKDLSATINIKKDKTAINEKTNKMPKITKEQEYQFKPMETEPN